VISDQIRNTTAESGIDVVGFTDASPFSDYMIDNSIRKDPKITMPEAKSIIVVGIYIGGMKLPVWDDQKYGRTSRLYLSGFFLDVIKPLEPIVQLLRREGYKAVTCDSSNEKGSILPLKLAAVRAGLGWQGKHTLLISKKYGSFLALGGILTDAVLDYCTAQVSNKCNRCTKCQTSCPMDALENPFKLYRDRCLSYLLQTDHYPDEARDKAQNRIGDCEICQDACPWNQKHIHQPLNTKLAEDFGNKIESIQGGFLLTELEKMTSHQYKENFGKFHTEIPFDLFSRNVKAAISNQHKYYLYQN